MGLKKMELEIIQCEGYQNYHDTISFHSAIGNFVDSRKERIKHNGRFYDVFYVMIEKEIK